MKRLLLLALLIAPAVNLAAQFPPSVQSYELKVKLDTSSHRLVGEALLEFLPRNSDRLGFFLNASFQLKSVLLNGKQIKAQPTKFKPEEISADYGKFGKWSGESATYYTVDISRKLRNSAENLQLAAVWSGELYSPPDNRQFSREKIAFEVSGTIGGEGAYLSPSAWWYPFVPDQPASYRVSVEMPRAWNCVTSGTPTEEMLTDYSRTVTHDSPEPLDGLHLSAGPFVIQTAEHRDVVIATYFLPEQASLSEGYIQSCREYLDLYAELIGPYPFTKFAVVDNFLPSGYGMAGWTLLGSEVLRLPFIRATSLGHEVLHNWWGNSLWVDYREGNWCEGLTSYMADYLYKEKTSPEAAREYRLNVLRDFSAYVTPENDYPAADFVSRSDAQDRAVGYGKVMMIFHMLRRRCDEISGSLFHQVMARTYAKHQWSAVGWSLWQRAFELALGEQMELFFAQWVKGTGAPSIRLGEVDVTSSDGNWHIQFPIQCDWNRPEFILDLPVRIKDDQGEAHNLSVRLDKQLTQFTRAFTGAKPVSVELDPDMHLMRWLYPAEMPLTLAEFYGDESAVIVVPSGESSELWAQAAEGLKSDAQRVLKDTQIGAAEENGSLWLLGGTGNALWSRYAAGASLGEGWVSLAADTARGDRVTLTVIRRHPANAEASVVLTCAMPAANAVEGTRKLSHYGKYSAVAFNGDRNVLKVIHQPEGGSPMSWKER